VSRRKLPALDFANMEEVRRWLTSLEAVTDDLISVAFDQTEPIAKRELGRAEASRIAAEATNAIDALIMFACRGLPDDDAPESGDPAGSGDAGPR
jgi:hypothetical protein